MVALVTGAGLGLLDTTANQLKGAGVLGDGKLGQAGGSSTVNLASGNLVLQFLDESLAGSGADLRHMRTYNSQGDASDGDGDRWRWLGEKRVTLQGTLNTAGSTVTRTTGDGHEAVYSWNGSAYVSSTGTGADDTIVRNGSQWVWTEGSTKASETYNASTGWISSSRDTSGNGFDYTFVANRLTRVSDAVSGQTLDLIYNTDNRLARLDTSPSVDGTSTRQVYYAYDSLGRLSSVTTDLTLDNSIADGNVYTTSYLYDGDSTRVERISQSDGSQVDYTYINDGGTYKIQTVTDQSGTTTFSYSAGLTEVTNGAGHISRYFFDAQQRLTRAESAPVSGQVQAVDYEYDSRDNVTLVTDGKGQSITYTYDDHSNLTKEVDSLGNTVEHFYSNNRLISSTRYAQASLIEPSAPEISRYVYDSAGRVRFSLSGEGRVSESRYNAQGLVTDSINYTSGTYNVGGLSRTLVLTEEQLVTWANAQDRSKTELTRFHYDQVGNLSSKTAYASVDSAGNGIAGNANTVTEYVYSEYGQLLQTISVTGTARDQKTTLSSHVYDGMGRLLSSTSDGVTTSSSYADKRITVTNSATNLSVATVYDIRGRVLSVTSSGDGQNRITKHYYDDAGRRVMSEDALGRRRYTFYDAAGRVSYKVSADGAVTSFSYDANGRVTSERHYANKVGTGGWFNGTSVTQTTVSVTTHAEDRLTSYVYDNAGRLQRTVEEFGAQDRTRETVYDGASRVIQSGLVGRETRYFYDKDGHKLGNLNAEGYLTEHVYDAAGRVTATVRYGQQASDTTADFATLQAAVAGGERLSTYYFYDAQGRQVGEVNEQGFLTETVFDAANRKRYSHTYMNAVTVSAGQTLAQVKAAAGTDKRTSTTTFDAYGRISTVQGHDGTISRTVYDSAGRVVRSISAENTSDQTATRTRYNAFGEVTGVVAGEGEALVSDLNSAIDQYGKRYQYDAMGRKIAELGPQGQKTLFYYDSAGRLSHAINALGEVSVTQYNSFGQVSSIRILTNRISVTGLTGGSVTSDVIIRVTNAQDDSKDKVVNTFYNQLGLISRQVNAESKVTRYGYNQYGDRTDIYSPAGSDLEVREHRVYNKLGQQIKRYADYDGAVLGGVDINPATYRALTDTIYDGFGRVTQVINPNNQSLTTDYENGGRTITVSDALGRGQSTTYDALGRKLTVTDAVGKVTTYTYDDLNRATTVTTAEGISATTWKTRTGQTLKVQDGNGNITHYTYTKDGNLKTVTDALGNATEHTYDKSGRLFETLDAKGTVVRFSYDAANRQIQKAVDPTGLNIRTHYSFDGQGRKVSVTEAYGTTQATQTEYRYDRNGRLTQTILDPQGMKLSTRYTYDDAGNKVRVERGTYSDPSQQVSDYEFDALGRKTKEVLDPGGLDITTRYHYDKGGNLTRVIDANKHSTWFVYNAAGEKTFSVNALGEVVGYQYDANGKVHHTRQYFNKVNTSTWDNSVNSVSIATHASDRRTYTVRDDDGRERFSLTATDANSWVVTENIRDANGNIVETRRYDRTLATGGVNTMTSGNGVITSAELESALRGGGYRDVRWGDASTSLHKTRRSYFAFDAADRLRFAVDAAGYVTETRYDAVGNVTKTISYGDELSAAQLQGVLTDSIYDNNGNTADWMVYDADPAGATIQRVYDSELGQYVTEVKGSGTANGYRLQDGTGYWNNPEQSTLSWQMKYGESYIVYVSVDTNKGHRYLQYNANDIPVTAGTGYHHFGIGSHTNDGEWISVTRNLAEDLKLAEPDAVIKDVNAFLVRGSGRIANVKLHNSAEAMADRIDSLKAADAKIEANARTMEYRYDAANRQVAELSSVVTVTASSNTPYTGKIKTTIEYNALGQVTKRHEGIIERSGTTDVTIDRRTTEYRYDKAGNQTLTILAGWYDSTDKRVYQTQAGQTDRFQRTVEVTYDALGNAIQNKIRTGRYSYAYQYKAYDAAGREIYDIDAQGHVTEKRYDGLGNLVTTTRYGDALNAAKLQGVLTDSVYESAGNTANWHVYDADPAGATIQRVYDSELGQNVTEVKGSGTSNGYRLQSGSGYWNHAEQRTLSWQMKYGEDYTVYISVDTNKGHRYLTYRPTATPVSPGTNGYHTFGLGAGTRQGEWISITRDLAEDLRLAEPDAVIKDVNALLIRGSGRVANVKLHHSLEAIEKRIDTLKASDATIESTARTITHEYDAAGRKVRTLMPLAAVDATGNLTTNYASGDTSVADNAASASTYRLRGETTYAYNSFGELVQQNERIDQNRWAKTFYYYDQIGRQTLVVDSGNYGTATEYDAFGNVKKLTEYANRWAGEPSTTTKPVFTASSGKDRITSYTYDAMGRQLTATQEDVFFVNSAYGGWTGPLLGDNVMSTTDYNAFGEKAKVTDALGSTTDYQYNKLGHVTQVDGAARTVAGTGYDPFRNQASNVRPVTTYGYDTFGNVLSVTEGKTGVRGGTITLRNSYDHVGNQTEAFDGEGNLTEFKVDVNGRVTAQKQTVQVTTDQSGLAYQHTVERRFEYDAVGRQTATLDIYDGTQSGSRQVFNAFGEVQQEQKVWGSAGTSVGSLNHAVVNSYVYDAAGRVQYKQGADGYTYYYYDLKGNVTRTEQRESRTNTATMRVTENYLDLLGRVVMQRQPTSTAAESGALLKPIIQQDFDRWGNVVKRTDAGGSTTWYAYNHNNQLSSETSPTVLAHKESNSSYYASVVRSIDYDRAGRAAVEKHAAYEIDRYSLGAYDGDASGPVVTSKRKHQVFDAAGNTIATVDATGKRTHYAYDIHGNKVGMRNGVGNVHVYSYNRNGQVTEQNLLRQADQVVVTETTDMYGVTTTSTTRYERSYNGLDNTHTAGKKVLISGYAYDQAGRTYAAHHPGNNTEYYAYDARGNVAAKKDVMGSETRYAYDVFGNKASELKKVPVVVMQKEFYGTTTTATASEGSVANYAWRDVQVLSGYKVVDQLPYGVTDYTTVQATRDVQVVVGYKTPVYKTRPEEYISGYEVPVYSTKTEQYITGYKTPIYQTRTESYFTGSYRTPIYATKSEQYVTGYQVPVYSTKTETYISGYKTPIYATRTESYFTGTYRTPVYETQTVEYIYGYTTTSTEQRGSTPIYSTRQERYISGYTYDSYGGQTPVYSYRTVQYISGYKTPIYQTRTETTLTGYKTTTTKQAGSTEIWGTRQVEYIYGYTTTSTNERGSTPIYAERQVTYQSGTKIVSSDYGYTNATPVYGTRQVEYISGYKTTTTAERGSTEIWGTREVQYVYGYTTTSTAQDGSTPIYGERQVTYQSGTEVVDASNFPYGSSYTPVYSTRQVEYIDHYITTSTSQRGSTAIWGTGQETYTAYKLPVYVTEQEQYIKDYTTPVYVDRPAIEEQWRGDRWEYSTNDYSVGRMVMRHATDTTNPNSQPTTSYRYDYDGFGQLDAEQKLKPDATNPNVLVDDTSSFVDYKYWENGLLKSKKDQETQSSGGVRTLDSFFNYNVRGLRSAETHSTSDTSDTSIRYSYGQTYTHNTSSNITTRYRYDAQGRLSHISSPSGNFQTSGGQRSTTNLQALTYTYDEWGNRRSISATYNLPGQTSQTKTQYFTYDAEGRALVANGTRSGDYIVVGKGGGVAYTYDAAGRVKQEERHVSDTVSPYGSHSNFAVHQTTYNDRGLVETVERTARVRALGATHRDSFTAGTTTVEQNYAYNTHGYQTSAVLKGRRTVTSYRKDGQILSQTQYDTSGRIASKLSGYQYHGTGDLKSYKYDIYDAGQLQFTNTYNYHYTHTYTGNQVSSITVSSTQDNTATGETHNHYDHRGRLTYSRITEGHPTENTTGFSYKYFAHNAEDRIIGSQSSKYGVSGRKTQTYFYNNGNQVADIGDEGINITPINSQHKGGSTPGTYAVNAGDTLTGIAQALYGDGSLWYVVAEANALNIGPTDRFGQADAGRTLRIPNTNHSLQNTSTNFKPYNPGEIIGDLTPSPEILPPPKAGGCNAIAMIVMVVVAVAVTIFTAGAAATAMASAGSQLAGMSAWAAGSAVMSGAAGFSAATAAAAFAGGFVGSVASQGVGKAMGAVESFSLRNAFASGLTSVATMGLGYLSQSGSYAKELNTFRTATEGSQVSLNAGKAAAGFSQAIKTSSATARSIGAVLNAGGGIGRAAALYSASYASNKAAGIDTSFSWQGMAAQSIGTVAGTALGGQMNEWNPYVRGTVAGAASSSIAAKLNHQWNGGGDVNYGAIALDAFGNQLASAFVDRRIKAANSTLGQAPSQAKFSEDADGTGQGVSEQPQQPSRAKTQEVINKAVGAPNDVVDQKQQEMTVTIDTQPSSVSEHVSMDDVDWGTYYDGDKLTMEALAAGSQNEPQGHLVRDRQDQTFIEKYHAMLDGWESFKEGLRISNDEVAINDRGGVLTGLVAATTAPRELAFGLIDAGLGLGSLSTFLVDDLVPFSLDVSEAVGSSFSSGSFWSDAGGYLGRVVEQFDAAGELVPDVFRVSLSVGNDKVMIGTDRFGISHKTPEPRIGGFTKSFGVEVDNVTRSTYTWGEEWSTETLTETNFKVGASRTVPVYGVPVNVSFVPGIRHNTSSAGTPTASYNVELKTPVFDNVKLTIEGRKDGS
jgi:YD repeat-containing protein